MPAAEPRLSPVPLEETELPAAEDFVSQIHNQALLDAIRDTSPA